MQYFIGFCPCYLDSSLQHQHRAWRPRRSVSLCKCLSTYLQSRSQYISMNFPMNCFECFRNCPPTSVRCLAFSCDGQRNANKTNHTVLCLGLTDAESSSGELLRSRCVLGCSSGNPACGTTCAPMRPSHSFGASIRKIRETVCEPRLNWYPPYDVYTGSIHHCPLSNYDKSIPNDRSFLP